MRGVEKIHSICQEPSFISTFRFEMSDILAQALLGKLSKDILSLPRLFISWNYRKEVVLFYFFYCFFAEEEGQWRPVTSLCIRPSFYF